MAGESYCGEGVMRRKNREKGTKVIKCGKGGQSKVVEGRRVQR